MQYNNRGYFIQFDKNEFGDFVEISREPVKMKVLNARSNRVHYQNGDVVVYDLKILLRGSLKNKELVSNDFKFEFNKQLYKPNGIFNIYSTTGDTIKNIEIELIEDEQ